MKPGWARLCLFAGLAATLVACAPQGENQEEDVSVATQADTSDNGVSLNGVSVNGVSVNGVSVNGVSVNGVSINGVSANGVSINGVSANGVSVNGVSVNGVSVNGVSINGVSANGVSVNGVSVNGTAGNGVSVNGVSGNGVSVNGVSVNGVSVNGVSVNGVSVNGTAGNGVSINGVSVNGVSINGVSINGVSINGYGLIGIANGRLKQGTDFIGTTLTASLGNGKPLTMRINDVSTGTDPGIWYYDVSIKSGTTWQPLCRAAADNSVQRAIVLSGYWDESMGTSTGGDHIDDPTRFTFACETYALAKCVHLGYRPWETVQECKAPGKCHTLPLADFHQACTRALRADYCGNGFPLTRNGTLIDIYDAQGLQDDTEQSWKLEAEWRSGGARCVDNTRWTWVVDPRRYSSDDDLRVAQYVNNHCPAVFDKDDCGDNTSTMFTSNGYNKDLDKRTLLTTRVTTQSDDTKSGPGSNSGSGCKK